PDPFIFWYVSAASVNWPCPSCANARATGPVGYGGSIPSNMRASFSPAWKSPAYDEYTEMLYRYNVLFGRIAAARRTCSIALGRFRNRDKHSPMLLNPPASDGNLVTSVVYSSTHFCWSPVTVKCIARTR